MNFFNEDNFLHRFFLFAGNLIELNLLWLLSGIPLVTIGASTTALYYCTLKLHKDGEISIWKSYWKSFRMNFIQATALWLGLVLAGVCIWFESRAVKTMPGAMSQIFTWVIWAMALFLIVTVLYIFPVTASFENKIRRLIPFSLYFAVRKPGYALCIGVITCAPMYFTIADVQLFPVYLLVWLMCGFSLTAYGNSWFFWRLFRVYFRTDQEKNTDVKNESDQYVF